MYTKKIHFNEIMSQTNRRTRKNTLNESKHLNELSSDLMRKAAREQRKQLQDEDYQKKVSAYEFLKRLKRASDFDKYADEIIGRLNGQITDQTPQTRTETVVRDIPARDMQSRKRELKNIPGEKKFKRTENPIIPEFPNGNKRKPGKYVVRYISNFDDDVTAIWVEAKSINDAVQQTLHQMWDIKEILIVTLEDDYDPSYSTQQTVTVDNVSDGSAPLLDVSRYRNTEELQDAVAKTVTDGEFKDYDELMADIKADQTTETSAVKPIYEGEDILGNKWQGPKASIRRIGDEIDYDCAMKSKKVGDYDVEIVTRINNNGNDDIIDGRVTVDIMKKALREGIVHVVYQKADGSERQAYCTTNEDIVNMYNALYDGTGHQQRNYNEQQIRYYDLTQQAFRSFRIDRLRMVYDENY